MDCRAVSFTNERIKRPGSSERMVRSGRLSENDSFVRTDPNEPNFHIQFIQSEDLLGPKDP